MEHEQAVARCQEKDPGGTGEANAWEVRATPVTAIFGEYFVTVISVELCLVLVGVLRFRFGPLVNPGRSFVCLTLFLKQCDLTCSRGTFHGLYGVV